MSTSISELSTTPQLVFMAWTSTLSSLELERESPEEEQEQASSETSKESTRKRLSNGSLNSWVVPSSEQLFVCELFSTFILNLFVLKQVNASPFDFLSIHIYFPINL